MAAETPPIDPKALIAKGFENLQGSIADMLAGKADAKAIDQVKTSVDEITTALEGKIEKKDLEELREKFDARLDELEQLKPGKKNSIQPFGSKAVADAVVNHELWKKWQAGDFGNLGGKNGANGVAVPSLILVPDAVKEVVLAATELGAMVEPFHDMMLKEHPGRRVRVLDLIPVQDVPGTDSYKGRRVVEDYHHAAWYTTLAAGVTSGAGATATVASVKGLAVGATVKFHTAGGIETAIVQSFDAGTKVVTFTGTLNFNASNGEPVTAEVYAGTPESDTKPYQFISTESFTENLVTLATLIGFTTQRVNTFPNLVSFLQRVMMRRARQNYGRQVLYGQGPTTYNQLSGIMTSSDVGQRLWSACQAGSNRLDAILYAIEDCEDNGYFDLTISMHPRDWGRIIRRKTQEGEYLVNTMAGAMGPVRVEETAAGGRAINGRPVVLDEMFDISDFLVADHSMLSLLLDQKTANFALGWINTQFIENEQTARYEETLGHVIVMPGAGFKGQWDSQP